MSVCVVTDGAQKIILFKGTHTVSNEHLINKSKGIGYTTLRVEQEKPILVRMVLLDE